MVARTLLCCIGRQENAYIREYVEHYKNLGFTNIVLYDNNKDGEEDFRDVIGDYLTDGYVILKDFRNKVMCQTDAYQNCYDNYGQYFDWIAFFDCDEFLILPKDNNISDFLNNKRFADVDKIHINWMVYGDSGEADIREGGVKERFLNPIPFDKGKAYDFPENNHIKAIVRTGRTMKWNAHVPHTPHLGGSIKTVNADGVVISNQDDPFTPYTFENAYLRHYTTKSAREFCYKMKRGFPDLEEDSWQKIRSRVTQDYFKVNDPTEEKIKIFKEELGMDLSYLLPHKSVDVEKSKDTQLFLLCFSKKNYDFLDNKYVTPLQVGAANGTDVCELKDNTGTNISAFNYFYIENTGLYWIWQNIQDAKYKGQMQYRRVLEGIDDNTDFDELFSKYDVITCEPFNHPAHKTPRFEGDPVIVADTVEQGYGFSNCLDDLLILELAVKSKHKDYAEDWDKYIKNGPDLYYSNGFILRSEDYDKYCTFLFDCLNEYLKWTNIHSYDDLIKHVKYNLETGKYIRYQNGNIPQEAIKWQAEVGGFLSERIWTLWLQHNYSKDKILTLPYKKMENQWI